MDRTINHPQETILRTYLYQGVNVELVKWTASLWCGAVGYAANNTDEPDVEAIMGKFLTINAAVAANEREADWDVCISLNYLSSERPNGVLFGFLAGTKEQPAGFDILELPPALYLRLRLCGETAKALGRESWQGGIPPYEWITEEIAPALGCQADSTLPIVEYYGYFDSEKNEHEFCFLYVPVCGEG